MGILQPGRVLEHWLTDRPSSPLLTYYGPDGEQSPRIELSGASTANAVHKAVNLFQHELLLDPGDIVWLDLPLHWQTPVLALAAWAAGLAVAVGPTAPVGTAATLGTGSGPAVGAALAVPLHPWGMPLGQQTPDGWEDYAALARIQPDRADLRWTPAAQPWLYGGQAPRSGHELLERARALQQRWALPPSARLLTGLPTTTATGLLAATLVPAAAGSAVILTTISDTARILRQEGNPVVASDV